LTDQITVVFNSEYWSRSFEGHQVEYRFV